MKITRRPATGLPDVGTTAPLGDTSGPEVGEPGRRGDRVDLSTEARLRASLRRELGDLEALPAEQVRTLRAELERGAYHRDPAAVAARFLSEIAADLVA